MALLVNLILSVVVVVLVVMAAEKEGKPQLQPLHSHTLYYDYHQKDPPLQRLP
jgi:hypothetical protein